MNSYTDRIRRAKEVIKETQYILIGAGAGLSDAAGLKYSGSSFSSYFKEFISRYHFTDLYTSSFYAFNTEEERWAYWAAHIYFSRYKPPATALYQSLHQLVSSKDYFVLTTNVDGQFYKSGFGKEKIFATQGDYGLLQCAKGCHNQLYDNQAQVKAMLAHTENCRIPSFLVPKCPVCGGQMEPNLRKDNNFVQDENWYQALENYENYLDRTAGKKIVYLELGVGFNTPGVIRFPFEQQTYGNKKAVLIRMNKDFPQGEKENAGKTIAFDEQLQQNIRLLLQPPDIGSGGIISSAK